MAERAVDVLYGKTNPPKPAAPACGSREWIWSELRQEAQQNGGSIPLGGGLIFTPDAARHGSRDADLFYGAKK